MEVVQQSLQSGLQQILHAGFLVSSIVGWRFFGCFLYNDNRRVLGGVWAQKKKEKEAKDYWFLQVPI
jgi:hypothetical protein